MADVFISYSRRDGLFVRRLAESIEGQGKEVWIDTEGIEDAEVFPEAIRRAIERSDAFLFVIDPHAVESALGEMAGHPHRDHHDRNAARQHGGGWNPSHTRRVPLRPRPGTAGPLSVRFRLSPLLPLKKPRPPSTGPSRLRARPSETYDEWCELSPR